MTGYAVLLITLVATSGAGAAWLARRGRLREVRGPDEGAAAAELVLDAGTLGRELGERATLVQFSSAFCAPCRATRRILTEVAVMVDGVEYAEVDAERHLDVVRRLRIMRTPTTLVLDRTGRVVVRASGQPRKADVLAALGRVLSRELQSQG